MHYCFGDFTLDPTALLFTRNRTALEVPRRVFLCLSYLIAQRERAICRDELIRHIWGRDNVSDHQLAQVILAARHLVGDDGTAQRLIRTVQSFGYHWVGAVVEVSGVTAEPAEVQIAKPFPLQASLSEPASIAPTLELGFPSSSQIELVAPAIEAVGIPPAPPQRLARKLHAVAWLVLVLVMVTSISWQLGTVAPSTPAAPVVSINSADPLLRLREALRNGQFEAVREGLVKLPVQLADSAEGRMLEIELDLDRGRWPLVAEKLAQQQVRARAAADPVWQAKLFMLQSRLNRREPQPGSNALAAVQSALDLLESVPSRVSPKLLAEAFDSRGKALTQIDQLDAAIPDYVRARDLYLSVDETLLAADTRGNLARVWMQQGRLLEALEQMTTNASLYADSHAPIKEIFARNTAIRIQIGLLRWSDALVSSDRSMQLLQGLPAFGGRHRPLELRAMTLTGLGRLREAASMLEEAEAERRGGIQITFTSYYLASGQTEQALNMAAAAFAGNEGDMSDVLFENSDGALMLWMIAAQQLVAKGKPMPVPSAAQLAALQQAESTVGRIARGRWLWSLGKSQEAETELRLALTQARQANFPYRILLASEPLVELLLERGEKATAAQVLTELRAHDPDNIDQDYHANVLRLRLALASGQQSEIAAAYKRTAALAGERSLPAEVLLAYEKSVGAADGRTSARN
jgi:DNA-binding winged helix-turn-helix (wHTH) protein/tetratricopeptide (TPR) repeat protein